MHCEKVAVIVLDGTHHSTVVIMLSSYTFFCGIYL